MEISRKNIIKAILKMRETKQIVKSFLQNKITKEQLENKEIKLYGKICTRK